MRFIERFRKAYKEAKEEEYFEKQSAEKKQEILNQKLNKAVEMDSKLLVEKYLNAGALPTKKTKEIAIKNDCCQAMKTLIDNGTEVTASDLCYAINCQSCFIFSLLVEHVKDLNAVGWYGNVKPLIFAYLRGNYIAAEKLLQKGADPNVLNGQDISYADDIELIGSGIVNIAVFNRSEKLLELAMRYGANPNIRAVAGENPLHYAMVNGLDNIVNLLLEYDKLDVYEWPTGPDSYYENNHENPLNCVVRENNKDLMLRVLKRGGKSKTYEEGLAEALCYAVKYDKEEIFDLLIKMGANPNALKGKQNIALCEAADKNSVKYASMLLEHNADVNIVDDKGRTPIFYAATSGVSGDEVLKFLKENGADLNVVDNSGVCALNKAIERHCNYLGKDKIKFLIENGAILEPKKAIDTNVNNKHKAR